MAAGISDRVPRSSSYLCTSSTANCKKEQTHCKAFMVFGRFAILTAWLDMSFFEVWVNPRCAN